MGKVVVAMVCHKHGFVKAASCPECEKDAGSGETVRIQTGECWAGWYRDLDINPIYIESKKHLVEECEKRGKYAKALMKPKSQGKGYEHSKGYGGK